MSVQTIIAYPNFIADLGGPRSVRTNGRSAWVELTDRTIRMPWRLIEKITDSGLAVGEAARTYAYRNL